MKKIFKRKKKSASEAGSIGSGLSGSAYNVSPKKDLGKLHRAAFEGDLTKLKAILKRGDVNQLDKENRTPLHLACANGKYDAVRMLCDHTNINLNLCDNERRSALMKCVQCEHQTCLKILLDKGADVSLSDENGNTALHIAASIPNSDICYLLSDYHANPNGKNKDGATPLHVAASLGSDEIVKLMIASGVNVDELDENDKTPLMHAAHKGHLTTVNLLLSKNANSVLRDINGWTADDYASMDGHHPISHIIMEHNTRKRPASGQSRQSTLTRTTPKTTPQRLGVRSSSGIGSVTLGLSDGDSESDDTTSVSKATDAKGKDGSWSSSQSEDDEPKYASVQKKSAATAPKINVLQAMNFRKSTASAETKPLPSPTSNLFLTASAKQEIEKKQKEMEQEGNKSEYKDEELRPRYASKSAKGLPVSPSKPPLPVPRTSTSSAEKSHVKFDGTSQKDVERKSVDSSWDSPDEDPEVKTDAPDTQMEVNAPKVPPKSKESYMKELGFDVSTANKLYAEYDKTESQSEASSDKTQGAPEKPLLRSSKDDDYDSWDDSFSEKQPATEKKSTPFNFFEKSASLKFADEVDSEHSDERKPTVTAALPIATKPTPSDDEDSWNSEDIKGQKEQPKVSPKSKRQPEKSGLQEPKRGLEITYGKLSDSDWSDSEVESESSWERDNKRKSSLQRTVEDEEEKKLEELRILREKEAEEARLSEEKERLRKQEEIDKKREADERAKEEKLRKEAEDRKREEKQKREAAEKAREEKMRKEAEDKKREEKRRKEEERLEAERKQEEARKQEEERRRIEAEVLEKVNKQNQELERINAELKKKAQEEEQRQAQDVKTDGVTPGMLNESLKVALQKAADISATSSDSEDEDKKKSVQRGAGEDIHPRNVGSLKGAPVPISTHNEDDFRIIDTNLDTLTEETESEEDLSLSDNVAPGLTHSSTLSDSIKLTEEKHKLHMQLTKQQDAAVVAQEKLEAIKKEYKQLKLKDRTLNEEKKAWELEKVDMLAEKRKLSFDVDNLLEKLGTVNLTLKKQEERSKRLEEQLQVERGERREQEVTVRDLRLELKNSNATMKQAELKSEELKKELATEKESNNLARTIQKDNMKLSSTLQTEAMKDDQVEILEKAIQDKNQELIKVQAERNRYEDASVRYKEELVKLRSQDSDQHGQLVQINQDLNDKLDEKELELRESEEALQLTALQSLQFKQALENTKQQLTEIKREKDLLNRDLELMHEQQAQTKADLEDARLSLLREQDRTAKLDDSQEKLRHTENELQGKLLDAERKASRLENELQISQSSNKQRTEDNAKWENECEKLREASKENERNIVKLEREVAEQSGKLEAMKIELHQRESECIKMRQEKEDLQSRSVLSAGERQDQFNEKLSGILKEHENERVAFETRNIQLAQQIEHWKSEVERIKQEKHEKEEELAEAQQDRIEAHKKLGYADAFSKSASKEQKQLMDENVKVKQDNIKLQSQVSLLERKLDERSSELNDLQKEVDDSYQAKTNANKQIDSLSESQRLAQSSKVRMEQLLKEAELENIRLKSELESSNSWKDRLQESREHDAYTKVQLEEKISKLECDRVLAEEKLAAEIASAKILKSEAGGHKNMWESEVKSRSKLEVELSKVTKEAEDERMKAELLSNDLTKATREKKAFKTKYEQLKREKMDADRRAESYRSAMHNAGRKAADTESECESQISMMDEQHAVEMTRRENTIAKLREQVTDLMQQLKEKKKPYFPEGPTDAGFGVDELKKVQFENDKLKEELQQLRTHIKESYVDKAELESARQEERIKAQATLAPTLDQVNSFLKNQQIAQEFRDQLIQKREESTAMKAAMRIAALEDELRTLKRKQDDESYRMFQRQEAEMAQLYDSAKRKNEVLEQQLLRANGKAEEYKGYWIKERKKFQNFFTNTLGGSIVPNGIESTANFASNSFGFSPSTLGKQPLLAGAFSSTPKKDSPDPLLSQLRTKLDATIAQRLSGARESPLVNGNASSGSSVNTPRSDRSAQLHEMGAISGHKSQNEYMSFLLS